MTIQTKTKTYGGSQFPPFAVLQIGDKLDCSVSNARVLVKKEKNKKGKVEESAEPILELTLLTPGAVTMGSKEKGTDKRATLVKGDTVSLSVSGNLFYILQDVIGDAMGEKLPEGFEWSDELLAHIVGQHWAITRMEDGVVKTGKYQGKPRKMFMVDVFAEQHN